MQRHRLLQVAAAAALAALLATGCGGSGSSGAPAPANPSKTADATSAATGDIPDNQMFLTFRDAQAGYSLKYPEGWTRRGSGQDVAFVDKDNRVHAVVSSGATPTTRSVSTELARLRQSEPTLAAGRPRPVSLKGGKAVTVSYTVKGAPNAVTGKRPLLLVDRYVYAKAGRVATLDLASPKGVDNVDAYRLISGELLVAVKSLYVEPDLPVEPVEWPALECHDVFKIYRSGPVETVALRGLDVRIERGEVVAILGPSGGGKSTLLALAAGLDLPSAGEVRVFGRSLGRLDEGQLARYRAREVALIFQSDNLWPVLSAEENVLGALRLADDRRGGRERAAAALDAFGVAERGRNRVAALSGGEQQRVAIAAAAVRSAPLVLADEPTGELDERNERVVLEALTLLRDQEGSTVVVVTHSERVAAVVDRTIELRDGRVIS